MRDRQFHYYHSAPPLPAVTSASLIWLTAGLAACSLAHPGLGGEELQW